MEVVESIYTRLGIIFGGTIVAEGTMNELRTKAGSGSTLEQVFLRLTKEEESIADSVSMLRGSFFHDATKPGALAAFPTGNSRTGPSRARDTR